MALFQVFQAQLTEAQYTELNGPNGGWGAKPEFSAYADIGMGSRGDREADAVVRAAAEAGLFVHASNINADDVTDTFAIGNIGPEDRITRFEGVDMYSVSVGNVMINTESGTAWMCDSFGWVELFAKTRDMVIASKDMQVAA